jgi:UDP-N-acetylmuramoyl-tripeptide--D-alanyl-D-alanine ligase
MYKALLENPSSMKVSLENFIDFIGTKTIIIGDMLELGEESAAEHSQILELAKSLNFNEIITVGPHFKEVNASGIAFLTTQDLIHYLTENEIHSQNILLKASRGIALEKALEFIK